MIAINGFGITVVGSIWMHHDHLFFDACGEIHMNNCNADCLIAIGIVFQTVPCKDIIQED
jgi:hypothetical protein